MDYSMLVNGVGEGGGVGYRGIKLTNNYKCKKINNKEEFNSRWKKLTGLIEFRTGIKIRIICNWIEIIHTTMIGAHVKE